MAWITAITGFLGALSPLTSIVGAGLGALVTYFVNKYISQQQAQQAAITSMDVDMDAHASDGALSVADMNSAESQLQQLQTQAAIMDKQQTPQITKGPS